MKKTTLTCPFTGLQFDATIDKWGNLIVNNKVTGENFRMFYDMSSNTYIMPSDQFSNTEIVSSVEAADILGISRARISKIAKDNVIPHFSANGKNMFLKRDIIEYRDNRSVGRPSEAN